MSDPPQVVRIGLTGGIGSGKSTVAAQLALHGGACVDTDALAHELTGPGGAAMPALIGVFGPEVAAEDGRLDRPRMRQRAFADPSARTTLESILHPMIGRLAEERAAAALAAGGRFVVFDVPLLVESGRWRARVDRVVVVDCQESTQVRRVIARSGWDEDAVRRVIAQQARRAQRRAAADAVIFNDVDDLPALAASVAGLRRAWALDPATMGA